MKAQDRALMDVICGHCEAPLTEATVRTHACAGIVQSNREGDTAVELQAAAETLAELVASSPLISTLGFYLGRTAQPIEKEQQFRVLTDAIEKYREAQRAFDAVWAEATV